MTTEGGHRLAHRARSNLLREAGYRVVEAGTYEETFRVAQLQEAARVLLQEDDVERFRMQADIAPTLMWMNSPDGCEFLNKASLDFLGLHDAEVRGFDWAQYVHPDDRQGYVTAYLQAVVDCRLFEATFRFKRHDGQYRWMKSVGTPRFAADGTFLGYVGSTQDITNVHSSTENNQDERARKPDSPTPRVDVAPSPFRCYGLALLCAAGAVFLRWLLDPTLGPHLPLATIYGSVAIVVSYGGWAPALLTVVASYLAANWLFLEPKFAFHFSDKELSGLSLYLYSTLLLIGVGEAMRRAQSRARLNAALAEERRQRLETEIEARDLAEQTLRASDERLRILVNGARDYAIFLLDPEGHVASWNEGAARVFGYRQEEILGTSYAVFYSQEAIAAGQPAHDLRAAVDGRSEQDEPRVVKDGSQFIANTIVTALRNEDQSLRGFAVVTRDITERKLAETALRKSEERFHGIFSQTLVGIAETDHAGRFVSVNPRYCEIVGRSAEELCGGMRMQDITHPDDLPDNLPLFEKVVQDGAPFLIEKRYMRSDGSHVWVSNSVSAIKDVSGQVTNIVSATLDITERKQAEEALRVAQERLQRWNTELERAVHEKTAELQQSQDRLRALASELNLAEQRERKRLATELHDHLQQMLVFGKLTVGQGRRVMAGGPGSDAVLKTVDDMLSDALTYTRTLVADLSPTVLRDHGLAAALKWLGRYMQKHHQSVTVTVADGDGLTLPEDQVLLLFQCVRELLINSSKHAATGEATVRMYQDHGMLQIEVKDDGQGFDLAAAAAAAAAAAGISSGGISSKFGLFSIQERMRALGGGFEVQSAPGQGTIATLMLPIAPRAESPALSDAPISDKEQVGCRLPLSAIPTPTVTRVLLVDDHAMVRQGLRSVLDAYADLQVVGEARDGVEALTLVEELRPAVVVMDINMPIMNGIEATTQIKIKWPHIIIIGISVNVGDDNATAMRRAGAATLLTKEAAVDQLHETIKQAVDE